MKTTLQIKKIADGYFVLIPAGIRNALNLKAKDFIEVDIKRHTVIKRWYCKKCGNIFDASESELDKYGCTNCLNDDLNEFEELENDN